MDVFGHVNHANLVTLLEEARVPLLFEQAGMGDGIVVARLVVDYHAPLRANGSPVRVEIGVSELRNASFTLDYTVHSGRSESDTVAATAQTMLVPYNIETQRPRRLTADERTFLTTLRGGAA